MDPLDIFLRSAILGAICGALVTYLATEVYNQIKKERRCRKLDISRGEPK